MPFVEIKMWPGRSRVQKEALVAEITEVFCRVAGTQPQDVHIVIQEVDKSHWAISGKLSDSA